MTTYFLYKAEPFENQSHGLVNRLQEIPVFESMLAVNVDGSLAPAMMFMPQGRSTNKDIIQWYFDKTYIHFAMKFIKKNEFITQVYIIFKIISIEFGCT